MQRIWRRFNGLVTTAWCACAMFAAPLAVAVMTTGAAARHDDEPTNEATAVERVTTPPLTVTTTVVPDALPKFSPYKAKQGEHTNADELLAALETAGDSLQTLTADLKYFRRLNELEGGETQIRTGMLLFRSRPGRPAVPEGTSESESQPPSSPAPRREFQIDFTRLEIDGRARDDVQTFIFDGEWLIERYPEQKEIHRRQVVAAGQVVDPLSIGEGPFPIPIGQKRERILSRFDAYLVDPADGWASTEPGKPGAKPNWLDQTYQLLLVPRRGTDEARQYRLVRLWYIKGDLLPRMVRAEEANDSITEVLLMNLKPNAPLPAGAFDTRLPPGWNERVDNFRPQSGR